MSGAGRTSAPASSRAAMRSAGASGAVTTRTGDWSRVAGAGESSGRRAWESKTTRRGWRAPSMRAVSSGSSARTVPMPTAIASDSARQRWTSSRLSGAGDPGRVAGGGRGLAVERHRQLQDDERQAGAGVLAEGLVEAARGGRLGAGGEGDLDAAVAEDARAAAGGLLARIVGGDHDAGDPGLEDRLDAGRLPPLVGAGLERHVHRRPGRVLAPRAAVRQRRPLGVQPAELGVEALADHLAVADDHGADQRIGADPPAPALGQLQRPRRCARSVAVSGGHRLIDSSINQEFYPLRWRSYGGSAEYADPPPR